METVYIKDTFITSSIGQFNHQGWLHAPMVGQKVSSKSKWCRRYHLPFFNVDHCFYEIVFVKLP